MTIVLAVFGVPSDHPLSSHVPSSEPTTNAIDRIAKSATRKSPVATTSTPNATGKQMAKPWYTPLTSRCCVTIHTQRRAIFRRRPRRRRLMARFGARFEEVLDKLDEFAGDLGDDGRRLGAQHRCSYETRA